MTGLNGWKPPHHLSSPTQQWWLDAVHMHCLEEEHHHLLTLAAECWERCQDARRLLAEQGLTYRDPEGFAHLRPEVAVERENLLNYARALDALGVFLEPPPEPA
ncbi:MAG TPA: hypothetical protein PKK06_03020 [Phycisphaerae bacterium]|nr:hypothetical protein [Phycisphaerae bacterium]HNU44657.1 hypothetical protein [Phycisphaerae bacterium]